MGNEGGGDALRSLSWRGTRMVSTRPPSRSGSASAPPHLMAASAMRRSTMGDASTSSMLARRLGSTTSSTRSTADRSAE